MIDILEGLNQLIEEERVARNITTNGHLVLQSKIESNETFKVYKTFITTIWYIKESKKYKVLTISLTDKVMNGQEEIIESNIAKLLSKELFKWIKSVEYEQIVKGETL